MKKSTEKALLLTALAVALAGVLVIAPAQGGDGDVFGDADAAEAPAVGGSLEFDGLKYTVHEDGTCSCDGFVEEATGEELVIPGAVSGHQVTGIGENAFEYCKIITSVTMPDSVQTIGSNAFGGCEALKSVTLPDSLKTIRDHAFWLCYGLETIAIPDGVQTIEESAFQSSGLTSVAIPGTVQEICNSTFRSCDALESVTIPDGVQKIGSIAFDGCEALESMTIPDSVMTIGSGAFGGCKALKSVTIPDGVQTIEGYAFSSSGLISVAIPGTVQEICNSTFRSCEALESVTIPDSVLTIGENAFDGCKALKSVTIPDNVQKIDNNAFDGCEALASVTIPNNVQKIGMYTFRNCDTLESITIPGNVQSIGYGAFKSCDTLKSAIIEEGVQFLGGYAFYGCSALESVAIPGSITEFQTDVFSDCTALEEVIIGDGIPEISCTAFKNCKALFSVTIPDSVRFIRANAFRDCIALEEIIIGDGLQEIGTGAFGYCKSLKAVTLPDSLKKIEEDAFKGCESMSDITFEGNIQPELKKGCMSLTEDQGNVVCTVHSNIYSDSNPIPASAASDRVSFVYVSKPVTVTFNAGTGTDPVTIVGNFGTHYEIPPAPAAPDGKTFAGWFAGDVRADGTFPSEDTDYAAKFRDYMDRGLNVGDAWGVGGKVTHDDIDIIVEDIGALIPDGETKEQIVELVSQIKTLLEGYTVSDLDYGFEASVWEVNEIVEKGPSGYVVEVGDSITLSGSISATVTGALPHNLDAEEEPYEDTLVIKEISIYLSLNGQGTAYFDKDFRFIGGTMDEQLVADIRTDTNLALSDDGGIAYDRERTYERSVSLAADVVTDLSVMDGGLQFLPEEDALGNMMTTWTSEAEVVTSMVGTLYLDLSIPELKDLLGPNDSISQEINIGDTGTVRIGFKAVEDNGVYTITATPDDMGLDELPELEGSLPGMQYRYPFEANEAPSFLDAFESFELTPAEVETAWGHIRKDSNKVADFAGDRTFTVSFADNGSEIPGLEDIPVGYGGTVDLPELPSSIEVGDGETFMGWRTDAGTVWDGSRPVEHDLVLEPIIAREVQEAPTSEDFSARNDVVWNTDADALNDVVVENDLMSSGDMLFIRAMDADGKILYEWKLPGGLDALPDTVFKPEILDRDVPDDAYLSKVAADDPARYLDFKASGAVPVGTEVRYYVGDTFSPGDELGVYYDDGARVRPSGTVTVDKDGFITMPTRYCSGCMLTQLTSEDFDVYLKSTDDGIEIRFVSDDDRPVPGGEVKITYSYTLEYKGKIFVASDSKCFLFVNDGEKKLIPKLPVSFEGIPFAENIYLVKVSFVSADGTMTASTDPIAYS